MAAQLESAGYAVALAENSDEALRIVGEGGVDLIVTDVKMRSDLEGVDFVRELRGSSGTPAQAIPVIVVSGTYRLSAENRWRLGLSGGTPLIQAFIEKPVRRGVLLAAVEKHLGRRAAPITVVPDVCLPRERR